MPFAYNIRVMFVRIIIITHSDRALFNLNALVSSLGTIVPSAYGLGHYGPSSLHAGQWRSEGIWRPGANLNLAPRPQKNS